MNQADQGADDGEKPRGLRPWESVRAAKIRRARELLQDPDYPSKKTLDAVADVLAQGLVNSKRRGRRASNS